MPQLPAMQVIPVQPSQTMAQMQVSASSEISRIMVEEQPLSEKYTTHYVTKPIRVLFDDMIKIHAYTKNDKVVQEYYNAIYGNPPTYSSASYDSGIGASTVSLDELMEKAKSMTNIYRNYCGLERFYGGRAKAASLELKRLESEIQYQREIEKAEGKSKSATQVSNVKKTIKDAKVPLSSTLLKQGRNNVQDVKRRTWPRTVILVTSMQEKERHSRKLHCIQVLRKLSLQE